MTFCDMCAKSFLPYEEGADDIYCSYECASGTGVALATLAPSPCPCCETLCPKTGEAFAPYCSRGCWIEVELADEDDESLPTCSCCEDSYEPTLVKAQYAGFCCYSCWRHSTKTSTPTLSIRMPDTSPQTPTPTPASTPYETGVNGIALCSLPFPVKG